MERVRFEYIVIKFRGTTDEESFLNSAGEEGWELCCINEDKYYFKRLVQPQRVWKTTTKNLYATA